MKNKKRVFVNKYLENNDEIQKELEALSPLNKLNKNPDFLQTIFAVIIAIIVMGLFYFSNNLILVIVASILLFTFCLYLFIFITTNKNIEPKKRRNAYWLIFVVYLIVDRIIRLL